MFIQNKYTKWYYQLITKAQTLSRSKKDGIFERHHIIPRSLGGGNGKKNLVLLTPREHFICHLLLVKMCVDDKKAKMVCALHYMYSGLSRHSSHQFASRVYHVFRSKFIKFISGPNSWWYGVKRGPMSDLHKQHLSASRIKNKSAAGENNPMYGKRHTKKTLKLQSKIKKEKFNEDKRQDMIRANPKSKQVRTHEGLIFPSLSEAARHYNFADVGAARRRISKRVWEYV